MKSLAIRLWKEEEGQDITEYGLLMVLLALAAITMIGNVGTQINTLFTSADTTLTNVNT